MHSPHRWGHAKHNAGSQHKIAETPKEKFLERTDKLKMHQIRFSFFQVITYFYWKKKIEKNNSLYDIHNFPWKLVNYAAAQLRACMLAYCFSCRFQPHHADQQFSESRKCSSWNLHHSRGSFSCCGDCFDTLEGKEVKLFTPKWSRPVHFAYLISFTECENVWNSLPSKQKYKYSLNFGASIKSPFMELQVLLPLTFLDEGKTNFEQDKVAHPEHTAGWSVWSSLSFLWVLHQCQLSWCECTGGIPLTKTDVWIYVCEIKHCALSTPALKTHSSVTHRFVTGLGCLACFLLPSFLLF